MDDYIVHFVETRFYDVPVQADSPEDAYDIALDNLSETYLDHKSIMTELASWCGDPIEMVVTQVGEIPRPTLTKEKEGKK